MRLLGKLLCRLGRHRTITEYNWAAQVRDGRWLAPWRRLCERPGCRWRTAWINPFVTAEEYNRHLREYEPFWIDAEAHQGEPAISCTTHGVPMEVLDDGRGNNTPV